MPAAKAAVFAAMAKEDGLRPSSLACCNAATAAALPASLSAAALGMASAVAASLAKLPISSKELPEADACSATALAALAAAKTLPSMRDKPAARAAENVVVATTSGRAPLTAETRAEAAIAALPDRNADSNGPVQPAAEAPSRALFASRVKSSGELLKNSASFCANSIASSAATVLLEASILKPPDSPATLASFAASIKGVESWTACSRIALNAVLETTPSKASSSMVPMSSAACLAAFATSKGNFPCRTALLAASVAASLAAKCADVPQRRFISAELSSMDSGSRPSEERMAIWAAEPSCR
mmetsp:Transcript_17100/g.29995  ORF Transcript_17100/g.29995 Transcript_17100/m.29995 type:complete len:302 (+) Transcript_17100:211-1116(+)